MSLVSIVHHSYCCMTLHPIIITFLFAPTSFTLVSRFHPTLYSVTSSHGVKLTLCVRTRYSTRNAWILWPVGTVDGAWFITGIRLGGRDGGKADATWRLWADRSVSVMLSQTWAWAQLRLQPLSAPHRHASGPRGLLWHSSACHLRGIESQTGFHLVRHYLFFFSFFYVWSLRDY